MARKRKNALVHGIYSSDVVLPWEDAEDFKEILNGLRRDFQPVGTFQDLAVFDIAHKKWIKKRVRSAMQLALLESAIGEQIEESGKRSVKGIRTHLGRARSKQKRQHQEFMTDVSNLSQAATLLAKEVTGKKKSGLGKLGANIRYILDVVEKLQPIIADAAKADNNEDGIEFADFGLYIDKIAKCVEVDARLTGEINKAIHQLVTQKEYQRQYVAKSAATLLLPPGSKAMAAANAKTKKVDDNDWDNDNDIEDNDNENKQQYRQS